MFDAEIYILAMVRESKWLEMYVCICVFSERMS